MRQAIFPQDVDSPSETNLTPMLDVVFIMLIFFLVVAAFVRESGFDLVRSETNSNPPDDFTSILVRIDESSGIFIDGRSIDPRAVRANLVRLHTTNPDSVVVIQPDRHSANKALVQVMDAARQAGIYDIAMAAVDR